jgi:hypothetical protein
VTHAEALGPAESRPAAEVSRSPAGRVSLPDSSLFWRWVWQAVRPVLGWILAAAGTVSLFLAWFFVSGESLTAKQLPFLVSGGFAGIALFIMAGVFLATDDVRRQLGRLDRVEAMVDALYALFVDELSARGLDVRTAAEPAAAPDADDLVALPAGSSYHRAACPLVRGKPTVATVTPAEIAGRRLRPCRVCDPAAPGD